jgi:hypothetical protein
MAFLTEMTPDSKDAPANVRATMVMVTRSAQGESDMLKGGRVRPVLGCDTHSQASSE